MKTVITAILLDAEARANDTGGNDQTTDGRYQEPALLLPAFIRPFGGQMTPGNYYSSNLASLGQDVYNPASVFNYYSPSFVAPGSGGFPGPEFQLDNPNAGRTGRCQFPRHYDSDNLGESVCGNVTAVVRTFERRRFAGGSGCGKLRHVEPWVSRLRGLFLR